MGEKYKANERCWICGAEGNSGEHLLKASDIKLSFPDITQKKPAYYHDNRGHNNIFIQSITSKRLHSKAKICKECNNKTTQPYDIAWETLSKYLYNNSVIINKRKYFDLKKVFINDFKIQASNIQLYFVKLLGCHYWGIPDKKQICDSFSKSILNGCSREDISLEFSLNKDGSTGVFYLMDEKYKISKKHEIAALLYELPYIKIKIIYSSIIGSKSGWLPTDSKKIRLV